MDKAFIYCRVSTEEQVEGGCSLETQEKYCRNFADRNGYGIVEVFRDEGKSGTSLDRPALKALLSRIQEAHSIQAVIVQETDRLARNTKDHLTVRAILQKAGVKLISVAQPMLDDSPEGKMIDTIIASVNQFQSDLNSRKTKRGMQQRFDAGWWPAWAPLGYLNKTRGANEKIIAPDPERWHLVKLGFKMYLTGNYSAIELADLLHEKGLRSLTGKKICNSVMTNILRNPFYSGIMKWSGQDKQGRHKPMITAVEHERILQIVDAHNLHACRRRKHGFLLNGFAFCGFCGGRYAAEKHVPQHVTYYHCNFQGKRGKDKPHSNKNQNVEVSDLERQVEERFGNIRLSDDFIRHLIEKLKMIHEEQIESREARKKAVLNQKLAIERKRDRVETKLLDGVLTNGDFARIKQKLELDLAQIERQLDGLEQERTQDFSVIEEVVKLARNIRHTYYTAPYPLKRQYLALFWEKFIVQDKKIVRAIPSTLVSAVLKEGEVMIRGEWCPSPKLLIIMKDREYMARVKETLTIIKRLSSVA